MGTSDIVRGLDGAYAGLTALIDHRERVHDELSGLRTGLISLFSSLVCRVCVLILFISNGIAGGHQYFLPLSADHLHSVLVCFLHTRSSCIESFYPLIVTDGWMACVPVEPVAGTHRSLNFA